MEILPALPISSSDHMITKQKNMDKISINSSQAPVRKIICRYGPGCTHLLDPSHKEKFWHPSTPIHHNYDYDSQFIW